ncbi:unnamed protein product [Amoebophrya sp. A120]|nr:unnamed protein product [Amoebophrya sp. A120]|eukprot:GSA120T00000342001.1
MADVTAAPLVTLVAPTVDGSSVCGGTCIAPGWLHIQQIMNLIFTAWLVATSFALLSTLRTWVTGERNLFGIVPVTEETVDRVVGVQYWFATHGKWFLLVFSSCFVQLFFFIDRFESKQVAPLHSTLELIFGALVTIEFIAGLLHAMFSPVAVAMIACFTRFPIDLTIIVSSFMLGRIDYDTTDQIDALTVPENDSVTSVQPKTWYVPTQFIVFRLMYVWRRWFTSLPVSNTVFFHVLRGMNTPLVTFPFLFVSAVSIAIFEEVGFDTRWYLKGPPLAEDRYAVLNRKSFADPYGMGMPFFLYGRLWAPVAGGNKVPEVDYKNAYNALWTPLSTAYFYFMSLLTIGPGDLTPATLLGRVMTVISLAFGLVSILTLLKECRRLYRTMLEGKQAYIQKRGVKHVVVTGTPCFQQIQDFVTEIYHEEKMVIPPPVSAEFEPPPTGLNTETVVLLEDPETCDRVRTWLNKRENVKYRSRVFVYNGSVWDGLIPARAYDALMIFVLPNLYAEDIEKDDQSNVMRVLQMKNSLLLDIRIVVLLHVSEKKELLRSAGVADQYMVSLDDFKASIAMKSCFLPGFACFICNLFKTVAPSFAAKTETSQPDAFMPWEKMYFSGLEKEIYELDLSKAYYGLSFGEIVLDLLHRSEGEVLMIGIVEYGLTDLPILKLNPGAGERVAAWVFDPTYKDSPQLSQRKVKGVFIAPDVSAVAQKFYLPGVDDVGLKYRAEQQALQAGAAKAKARMQADASVAAGGNARLAALEKKRQRKMEEQEASKKKNITKSMSLKEKIMASKSGDLAQLYGVPSVQRNLDLEYPNTTMDEIPNVVDPVWRTGTGGLMLERKRFKRTLAEIHAVTDMKALNTTGLEMQTADEENVLKAAQHRQRLREFLELRVRPDIRAREMHIAHSDPKPPPNEVLAPGGHLIICCLGNAMKCQVRIYPAIRTLRLHSKAPLVILSQAVPQDWYRVLEAKGIYMLHGNPMNMFDLRRANFEHASCIVILAGSAGRKRRRGAGAKGSKVFSKQTEDYREMYRTSSASTSAQFVADTYKAPHNMNMVDSDGIFCCKLIEGSLPPLCTTSVILELLVDENYYLVPLRSKGKITSEDDANDGGDLSDEADMAAHRAALLRQPRYCCGKLFCSSMITSLMVNILYNTSLVSLVQAMIMCKGATVDVPQNWVGMPLMNFMESLMWHHNLIPVGIARLIKHEKAEKRKKFNPNELPPPPKDSAIKELTKDIEPRFIMAAPHVFDELLHLGDTLVCIAKYDVNDQDLAL